MDASFLHKVLKDPTRRDILHHLSNGTLTYMELLNLSKVTNTGRFNYHLKTLGALITKTEDGKYQLTEQGQLAVQLLEKFPEKSIRKQLKLSKKSIAIQRPRIPKKPMVAGILVLIIGISLFAAAMMAQAANCTLNVEWQQYLPGISGTSVIQTSDGGFLALGQNASIIDDSGPVFRNYTSIAVKTDSAGNVIWAKPLSFQGSTPRLSAAIEAGEGNYMLAGSNGVKIITENVDPQFVVARQQFCLVKIDSEGGIVWIKTYVHGEHEEANNLADFIQTSDGGFALVGTYTFTPPTDQHIWFVKVDDQGNLQWNKTISNSNYASSLIQTNDGGYVIVGTQTTHGPSPAFFELTKIDSNGNVQWSKTYGGEGNYYSAASASGIITDDGGYVIAGRASEQGEAPKGWIVKTDIEGNLLWNKTYTYNDYPSVITSISRANDNELVFMGTATYETKYGEFNADSRTFTWITQIDSFGNVEGQVAIEMGNYLVNPGNIIQTRDGDYVFVGAWHESAAGASVNQSFWMTKLASPSFVPPIVWLSAQVAIIIGVVTIELVIAKVTLNRISNSKSQV